MTWLYTIKAHDMTAKDVFSVVNLPNFRNTEEENDEEYEKFRWGADVKFENLPKLKMTTNVEKRDDDEINGLMSEEAKILQQRLLKELQEYLPGPDQDAMIAIMCDPVMMTAGKQLIFARGGADRDLWQSSWTTFEDVVIAEAKRASVLRDDTKDTTVRHN